MEGIGDGWLYGRKSAYRGKKKGRGRSTREQLSAGRAWCTEHAVKVAGEYVDDGRSASRLGADKEREDFERMIADIESGRIKPRDVVVTWQASRLYRDLAVYVQLRDACWRAGVFWCINGRLYDLSKREDRKASAYDAIQAEDEVYQLSDNVQRTLRANAMAGRPHGVPLWGLNRVFDTRTGELVAVTIDEEVAPIIRELFYRVKALESRTSIRRDLNARGILSPGGKQWTNNKQVTNVVTNPAYIGKRVHKGEIVADAMWPPLLTLEDGSPDEETFYKVQAIVGEASARGAQDTTVKHLLSGIAVCAECGDPALTKPHHSGYRVYWCRQHRHFSCKADPIDDYVTWAVVKRLARKDAARLYAVDREDPQTKKVLGDIARWQAELEEGEQLVERGELTMARLAKVEQRLLPKIEQAKQRLAVTRVDPLVAGLIRPSVEEVYAEWLSRDLRQQRAVIRHLVARLEIASVGVGRRGVHPEEHVTLEWRRRGDLVAAE